MTRVAAVQHDIVWADRDANFAHLAPLVSAAAAGGAELVVLTETFSTGFVTDRADIGEPEGGPSSRFLAAQAAEHGIWVAGSCPEIPADAPGDDQRPANTLIFAGPDGTQFRYRKVHPFTHGDEQRYYRAGSELVTFDVAGLRVSPFVCYDLRFADEFWQLARATDVYVVAANWPAKRRLHWKTLLHARAIENQAYVVGVNRVGRGPEIEYMGDTCIVHPSGEVLAEAAASETTLIVDIDPADVTSIRDHFRFMPDRRTG
jgi:predicted amidohydrolase